MRAGEKSVVMFWSLKAEKAHFEKIEVKVCGATFGYKKFSRPHVRFIGEWTVPRLIFYADQDPQFHLAGNDYNFALICKANLSLGHFWLPRVDELARNLDKNVVQKNLHTFLFKTRNWYFLPHQIYITFFEKEVFRVCLRFLRLHHIWPQHDVEK